MKRHIFLFLLIIGTQLNAKIEAYGADDIIIDPITKTVSLTEGDSFTFEINAPIKRKPLFIHSQNKNFISNRCKQDYKEDDITHTCTVKVKEDVPEGTFGVFQKNPAGTPHNVLFYISIDKNEEQE